VLPSCHQLDGLWTVTRSSRLASPGAADPRVRRMCGKFLHAAAAVLTDASVMLRSRIYGDSHGLNGALQAVAECAKWFPQLLRTVALWEISVDAAPYM
jgi:hypothetical protein